MEIILPGALVWLHWQSDEIRRGNLGFLSVPPEACCAPEWPAAPAVTSRIRPLSCRALRPPYNVGVASHWAVWSSDWCGSSGSQRPALVAHWPPGGSARALRRAAGHRAPPGWGSVLYQPVAVQRGWGNSPRLYLQEMSEDSRGIRSRSNLPCYLQQS